MACSLLTLPDGRLRVVLDDFRNLRSGDSVPWQHEAFVTFKDYERTTVSSPDIPEDEGGLWSLRFGAFARNKWPVNVGTVRSAFDPKRTQ